MNNIYVIKIKNLETGEEFLYSSFLEKENCLNVINQIKNFKGQNFIAIGQELDFSDIELQMAVENEEEKDFIEENIEVTYEEIAIEDSLIDNNNNNNKKQYAMQKITIKEALQKIINGEIEMCQLYEKDFDNNRFIQINAIRINDNDYENKIEYITYDEDNDPIREELNSDSIIYLDIDE